MLELNRRALLVGIGASCCVCGCTTSPHPTGPDPIYRRTEVEYSTREKPGTIVINPSEHFLYLVEKEGRALRYGVGVGAEGFVWSGVAAVDIKGGRAVWYPKMQYTTRKRNVGAGLSVLDGGEGVVGGPDNPRGARALYLWQGNKDTLYRIHGTNEPRTIGKKVSSR